MKRFGPVLGITILVCIVGLICDPAFAKKKKKGKKKSINPTALDQLEDGTMCGLSGEKWYAIKYTKKGKYKVIKKKNKKCRKELAETAAVTSFAEIPNIGEIFGDSNSAKGLSVGALGTPPTLGEIAQAGQDSSIKDIFFPPGVVEAVNGGSPSPEQCNQFFQGMSACYTTEGTAHPMEMILSSGASMCYLKNAPTAESGTRLVSGDGEAADVFTSGKTTKIVKVSVVGENFDDEEENEAHNEGPGEEGPGEEGPGEEGPGHEGPGEGGPGEEGPEQGHGPENIYIRILSLNENQEAGDHYHAQLIFCNPKGDSTTPQGYEDIRVTTDGQLLLSRADSRHESESFSNDVTAALIEKADGTFEFDPSQAINATAAFKNQHGSFKADILKAPGSKLSVKIKDAFGNHAANRYMRSDIQEGANISQLRFLEGAVKEQISEGSNVIHSHKAATRYGSSHYEGYPESTLMDEVNQIDFSTDPFYTQSGTPAFEPPFNCDAEITHEVEIDMSDPGFAQIAKECESNFFVENMNFCFNDSVVNEENAFQNCQLSGPEEGEGPGHEGPGEEGPGEEGPGEEGPGEEGPGEEGPDDE